jgi:hypothetical protein
MIEAAFFSAGAAMFAHVASSRLLRSRILDPELEGALFATPNKFLGTPDSRRLLRVRYFFPWIGLPEAARDLAPTDRVLLTIARYAGFAFVVVLTSLPVLMFLESGGHFRTE